MRFREHRYPCDMPVEVGTGDGCKHDGVVTNVSELGARLGRLGVMPIGARLQIFIGASNHPYEAEVRWSDKTYTGVRFLRPLTARTVAVVRQSVNHMSAAKPKAWNLQLRELS